MQNKYRLLFAQSVLTASTFLSHVFSTKASAQEGETIVPLSGAVAPPDPLANLPRIFAFVILPIATLIIVGSLIILKIKRKKGKRKK